MEAGIHHELYPGITERRMAGGCRGVGFGRHDYDDAGGYRYAVKNALLFYGRIDSLFFVPKNVEMSGVFRFLTWFLASVVM